MTDRKCTSDCAAGFALDGKEYILSCEPVPPSRLSPEKVGSGTFSDHSVDVRLINSGDRSGALAAGPLANFCGPQQPPADHYLYAYPL